MKSLYLSIAFAIAAVAAGTAIMSATFSGAAKGDAGHNPLPVSPAGRNVVAAQGIASVASLVGGLEDRLHRSPDDGKGWLLLAKSYRYVDRLDDARDAYKKAEALGQGDAVVAEQLFGQVSAIAAQLGNTD